MVAVLTLSKTQHVVTLHLCHREQTESLIDQLIHPGEAVKEAGSTVLSSRQKYSCGGCEESKGSAEKYRESELLGGKHHAEISQSEGEFSCSTVTSDERLFSAMIRVK